MSAADVPQAPQSSADKKEKIAKQAAIHNASKVAAASQRAATSATPSAFAQVSRIAIEFEILALQARLTVLEELADATDEEKMECLFVLLDKNRDGALSATEIADGLRRIRGDVSFEESLELAMERVAQFDEDGDARLQLGEFKEYVTTLSAAFGGTFHDFAEMFVLGVVFGEGNDGTEEVAAALVDADITAALREEGALARVMDDERMRCLFHMFDLDSDGVVDYIEVVNGIYKITEDLDEAEMTAMIGIRMFDEEGDAALDYEEFTRFVLRIVEASGRSFDESIYDMTKAAAEDIELTKEEALAKIRALAAKE